MLHDTKAMEAQMAEIEGKKAKAAYIKTRLVAELEGKRYEDPLMFKKFSERIQTTIDEYRKQRDENAYFEKMKQLADDFKQGLIGQHYPACIANDQKPKPFMVSLLTLWENMAIWMMLNTKTHWGKWQWKSIRQSANLPGLIGTTITPYTKI